MKGLGPILLLMHCCAESSGRVMTDYKDTWTLLGGQVHPRDPLLSVDHIGHDIVTSYGFH